MVTATIDHRFIDGAQGGILAKVVRRILENPWTLEPSEANKVSAWRKEKGEGDSVK